MNFLNEGESKMVHAFAKQCDSLVSQLVEKTQPLSADHQEEKTEESADPIENTVDTLLLDLNLIKTVLENAKTRNTNQSTKAKNTKTQINMMQGTRAANINNNNNNIVRHNNHNWKFVANYCSYVQIFNNGHSVCNHSQRNWRTVLFGNIFPIGKSVVHMKIIDQRCVGIGFVASDYSRLKGSFADKDKNSSIVYYDGDLYINGTDMGFYALTFKKGETVEIVVEMGKDEGKVMLRNIDTRIGYTLKLRTNMRLAFELGSKNTAITVW